MSRPTISKTRILLTVTTVLCVALSLVSGLLLLYVGLSFGGPGSTMTLEDLGVLVGFTLTGVGVGLTCFAVFAVGVAVALLGIYRGVGKEG